MKTSAMNSSQRGFSMIEVLIAVVVLGFGLMALAALQTTIIRSSAETKAQTIALQLAKDKIEDLRSFQDLAGYKAITSSESNEPPLIVSNVEFERSWVVERFAYHPSTGAFVNVSTLGLIGDTPPGGNPAIYVADNEYKTIAVTVNWTDANGVEQSVRLNDAIAALSPGDGSKVVLNNANTSQARKPQVRIYNPGLTGGVIPIAIGNGSSTAASNPTPVFTGSSTVAAETLFEVLTYSGTTGSVLAQSRVETAVVGCTCSTANAPAETTARGFRPTYWNGYRYATPTATIDKPTAGWTIPGGKNNTAESDRCNACCRDHRDKSADAPKFDPWRTTHDHYLRSGATLTLANTGTYNEACRLIRVDGFYRVATDFKNDYFAFLEVNNNGNITIADQNLRAYSPKVDTEVAANDAKKKYEAFILNYMDNRMSNNSTYTYNTPLVTTGLETTFDLNSPTISGVAQPITIKASAATLGVDSKWTHARGLYVDYIEPDAFDVIKNAYTNCPDKSTQVKRNACVLPFVPFTTVNLTELAEYKTKPDIQDATAVSQVQITAANNAFIDPITGDKNIPTRGNVYKGTLPTNNSRAFVLSYMTASNAGLALKEPIDVDETTLKDNQEYIVSTSSGSDSSGAVQFTVNLFTTLTTTFPSTMSSTPKVLNHISGSETCTVNSVVTSSSNPQTCSFAPDSSKDMNVRVAEYTKTSTLPVPNGCDTSNGSNATVDMPIMFDYDVISGTNFTTGVSGTITSTGSSNGTDNTIADYTVLKFFDVKANNVLRVFFSTPDRRCPSNYNKEANIPNKGTPVSTLNCTTGKKPVPTWSNTYVTCPSGTP